MGFQVRNLHFPMADFPDSMLNFRGVAFRPSLFLPMMRPDTGGQHKLFHQNKIWRDPGGKLTWIFVLVSCFKDVSETYGWVCQPQFFGHTPKKMHQTFHGETFWVQKSLGILASGPCQLGQIASKWCAKLATILYPTACEAWDLRWTKNPDRWHQVLGVFLRVGLIDALLKIVLEG